ncbi:hypothetical protein FB446DRAFT_114021 [Lentinula raphanica]|nr:hypothetical protein C8R42DRAFT_213710 [Lentinula raphanica]KAJ3771249.1 hypothetical protein FB446DRAFT_114021 [Lentinula raphanica]
MGRRSSVLYVFRGVSWAFSGFQIPSLSSQRAPLPRVEFPSWSKLALLEVDAQRCWYIFGVFTCTDVDLYGLPKPSESQGMAIISSGYMLDVLNRSRGVSINWRTLIIKKEGLLMMKRRE